MDSLTRIALRWLFPGALACLILLSERYLVDTVAICILIILWDGIATISWLFRCEPLRKRAWVVALIYASATLWMASLVAVVLMLASFLIIDGLLHRWPERDTVFETGSMSRVAVGFSAIASLLANLCFCTGLALADRWKILIWVGPEASRARRDDDWPPATRRQSMARRPPVNALLIMKRANGAMIVFGYFLALIYWAATDAVKPGMGAGEWTFLSALLATLVLETFVVFFNDRNSRYGGYAAATPEQCWRPILPADTCDG